MQLGWNEEKSTFIWIIDIFWPKIYCLPNQGRQKTECNIALAYWAPRRKDSSSVMELRQGALGPCSSNRLNTHMFILQASFYTHTDDPTSILFLGKGAKTWKQVIFILCSNRESFILADKFWTFLCVCSPFTAFTAQGWDRAIYLNERIFRLNGKFSKMKSTFNLVDYMWHSAIYCFCHLQLNLTLTNWMLLIITTQELLRKVCHIFNSAF